MDRFELKSASYPPRKRKPSVLIWNVLTILVLVTTLCIISIFTLIYFDPNSSINPFPPPTLFPSIAPPTATVTPRFTLVPSWTPTDAEPLVISNTMDTETPVPTDVPEASPTAEAPATIPPPGGYAFQVQQGSQSVISWTTFHPDASCDWSAVAGQATSLNGESVRGLFVQLGGTLLGTDALNKLTMTGLADEYGPGGFEFVLANSLVASEGNLWIQLLDQQNLPISDRIYFNTYADCEKNLVIITFDQVR
jgi:hypothetical protein